MSPLSPDQTARIEGLVGRAVVGATPVHRGYTPAERWVVDLEDGIRIFAKSGADSATSAVATWLRREHEAYTHIDAGFMPRLLAWDDDGMTPVMVLEDLSAARWPPPWTEADVSAVERALDAMAAVSPPRGAPDLETTQRERLSGWRRVAADPLAFLGIGLVTEAWLGRAMPDLLAASDEARLVGESLVHFDVRSDNVCVLDRRALVIDWPGFAKGNASFDRACWSLSLARDGVASPWQTMPDSDGMAALLAGYFAAQAGLPAIPTAPGVRPLQRAQLEAALPWVVRELGLPELDGGNAPRAVS